MIIRHLPLSTMDLSVIGLPRGHQYLTHPKHDFEGVCSLAQPDHQNFFFALVLRSSCSQK